MSLNLQEYLLKLNVPLVSLPTLSDEAEIINYLKTIYLTHVKTFPYSNFELRTISRQHPVQRQALSFFNYMRLLSPERGGYCYQSAALLADALKQMGYVTEYCAARGLIGAAINEPAILALPPTHLILIVTINNKKFLLDPGLGASAPRFPILITGTDELIVQNDDVFKFYKSESHNLYILEKKTSQGWLRLTQTDLIPLSLQETKMNLLQLGRHPQTIAIRDSKVVVGIITDYGRTSLFWEEQSGQLKFSKQVGNEHTQKILTCFTEGHEILKNEFGIHHISPEALKTHCTVVALPKPIKAWTVDFPLDKTEIKKMEANLTCSLIVKDSPISSTPEARLAHKNEFQKAQREISFNIDLGKFQTRLNKLLSTNTITSAQWNTLQLLHNEVMSAAKDFFLHIADAPSTKTFVDRLTLAVNHAKVTPDIEVAGVKHILNVLINKINILLEWIGFEKIELYVSEAKKEVLALRPEAGSVGFFEKLKTPPNEPMAAEYRVLEARI
jgi:N-hydroxyarylamine O-acetyltransferase